MISDVSRYRTFLLVFVGISFSLACSNNKQTSNGNLSQTPNSQVSSGPPVLEGFHDIATCDGIVGWAWDQKRPDDPIKVEIYDGDNLIATIPADTFRQDLLAAKKGNGKHGFTYALPPQLKDGKAHSIRVKYAGTSIDLDSTPKQLNCKFEG
jgi:hypothetical protein